MGMKISFLGVQRRYRELLPGYRDLFNKYHLEVPYYFARDGHNDVVIATEDYEDGGIDFPGGGSVRCALASRPAPAGTDVVIHFRRWCGVIPGSKSSIHLLMSQDHSFSSDWVDKVTAARRDGRLHGLLCFPTWHRRNTAAELRIDERDDFLIDGMTFGVDTETYRPGALDPKKMLWASDPGRGFWEAFSLSRDLWRTDGDFRLHVCWPDYVRGVSMPLAPWLSVHKNVQNGPRLWEFFGDCGILPYTSSFREPSSRVCRQAQAAGMVVLYPPAMGSPSELIRHNVDGIVAPINEWPELISGIVRDHERFTTISAAARQLAISENWEVQAQRFNVRVRAMTTGRTTT